MNSKLKILICLALVFLSLPVYWQLTDNGYINFDDDTYITDNYRVKSGITIEGVKWAFSATNAEFWHPIVWLSHMCMVQLFGLDPGIHHLANLILHILNSMLLFLVLDRMTGAIWKSALVAFMFAFHPINVEPVAWISSRKDVLSTLFWMLTTWFYIKYVEKPVIGRYFPVVLFFVLGLMSKPMLVSMPLVFLFLDFWPLNRLGEYSGEQHPHAENKRTVSKSSLVIEKLPLLILGVLFSFLTMHTQKTFLLFDIHRLWLQTGNAITSYALYIYKMFYPVNLAVYYPYPADIPIYRVAAAGSFLLFLTYMFFIKFKKKYMVTGWLWYIVTLLPVSGFIKVGSQAMADRYAYIPLIGLFIIVVWWLEEFLEKKKFSKREIGLCGLLLVFSLLLMAKNQVRYWVDMETLYGHALLVTENNYPVHFNLGEDLDSRGKSAEAVFHYNEALKINPDYFMAHNNLGVSSENAGDIDNAIKHYAEALRIKPDYVHAHNNMGNALVKKGDYRTAVDHYMKALQINPEFENAHYGLGILLQSQDRFKEAVIHFREVLRMHPDFAEAHDRLGAVLEKQGDIKGALYHYTEAINIKPGLESAHVSLASFYEKRGSMEKASLHYLKAIEINPDRVEVHFNLGNIYSTQGQFEKAIYHFREIIRINPGFVDAYNNLGIALARTGKTLEAVKYLEASLRINPRFAESHNSLGIIFAGLGKKDEALHHFREAIKIKPDYINAKKNLMIVSGKKE